MRPVVRGAPVALCRCGWHGRRLGHPCAASRAAHVVTRWPARWIQRLGDPMSATQKQHIALRRAVHLDKAGGGSDDAVDALAADSDAGCSNNWWRCVWLKFDILRPQRGAGSTHVLKVDGNNSILCRRATSLDRQIAALALPVREELGFRDCPVCGLLSLQHRGEVLQSARQVVVVTTKA